MLLGIIDLNELIILFVFILFPVFFYWLGHRSGYRKGQLDVYKEEAAKKSHR